MWADCKNQEDGTLFLCFLWLPIISDYRCLFFLGAEVLAVQKVLSGSGRARRLRLMGKYIAHRLVARSELDSTFWTNSRLNFPQTEFRLHTYLFPGFINAESCAFLSRLQYCICDAGFNFLFVCTCVRFHGRPAKSRFRIPNDLVFRSDILGICGRRTNRISSNAYFREVSIGRTGYVSPTNLIWCHKYRFSCFITTDLGTCDFVVGLQTKHFAIQRTDFRV